MQKAIYTNSRGQSIEFKNCAPFVLTKIDGTGGVKTTLLTTKAPGQDGKSHHGTLLEERPLNLEGAVVGTSVEDTFAKRQQLCSIFNPKLSGTLTYINDAGTHTIECTVEDTPTFKDKVSIIQQFLIQLYCPNPFWTDVDEYKEEVAVWIGDFEFNLELNDDTGIELGHRESNLIANINNIGDAECGMRIELTALASVVNPSILNIYTREYIKVKRTLQAGDTLIITTYFSNKKVKLVRNGIETNVFNYIDLSSTFLQLELGINSLRYDAEQGIDNLELAIYYKPLYLGV